MPEKISPEVSTPSEPVIPDHVARSISAVLEHFWDAEREHYRSFKGDDHVFRHLVAIEQWMSGRALGADDFVAEYQG